MTSSHRFGPQAPRPPRLAALLVSLFAARAVRAAVVSDLAERFAVMAQRDIRTAKRWYWRQALACLDLSSRFVPRHSRWERATITRGPSFLNGLQDMRYAVRNLLRRPGFAATAVLTLAIGIGCTTAIFSVVNGVLLRPLPYPEPERLVNVWQVNEEWFDSPNAGLRTWATSFPISMPVLRDWEELGAVFQAVGTYADRSHTMLERDRPERVYGVRTSSGVWRALGTPPLYGRTLVSEDDEVGAQPVAILGYGFWEQWFGADPDVIGNGIRLDDTQYTIVGVMPRGFYFPDTGHSLWTTFDDAEKSQPRDMQFMQAVARLAPGVSVPRAQLEMESLTATLVEARGHEPHHGVRVVSRLEEVVGDVQLILLVLLGAVAAVLLIACANIANMLLVRATERRRELAIRSALGAWRGRLLRQFLVESLVLSIVGGMAGVLVAVATFKPLLAALPPGLPRADEVALDHRVLLFAAVVSVLTGLLIGSLPALRASRTDVSAMLQESGRGLAGGRRQTWTQGILVVSEIALAFVLLVGCGLLVKSFVRLTSVDRGFDAERTLVFDLRIPANPTAIPHLGRSVTTSGPPGLPPDRLELVSYARQLEQRLRAVPGVQVVAMADNMPFMGGTSSGTTTVESSSGMHETNVERSAVSPSYFRALGIPILSGRAFADQDGSDSELVAIVSRAMAEAHWPGEDPVGYRLKRSSIDSDAPWMTVVGVADDVRHHGLDVPPRPKMYMAFAQVPRGSIDVILKTRVESGLVAAAVREAIAEYDRTVPSPNVRELETVISRSVAVPRFRTGLVTLFAVIAALLSVIGVYGVLSYTMTRRRAEVGIRMALGASPGEVLQGVLRRGATLTAIGLVVGLGLALLAVRVLDSFLFEASTYDPVAFGAALILLFLAAIGASYIPARRATSVDPVEALRAE